MLTPISIASTAAGPDAVTNGSSTSTAGRLLTMLDSTAATAAMPSSASSVVAARQHAAHRGVQAVKHQAVDDHAEAQYEHQERHIGCGGYAGR